MQGRENLLCLTVWASISSPLESKTSSEERITFMRREKERMKKKRTPASSNYTYELTRSLRTTRHDTTYTYSGMQEILFAASSISTDINNSPNANKAKYTQHRSAHNRKSLRNLFPTKGRSKKKIRTFVISFSYSCTEHTHSCMVLFLRHFLPFPQNVVVPFEGSVKRTSVNCIFMK